MKTSSKKFLKDKKDLLKNKLKESEITKKIREKLKLKFIVFLILVIMIFLTALIFISQLSELFQGFIIVYGLIAIFLISFLTEVLMQPIGPDVPIVIGILMGLNPIIVTIIALVASVLATILGYYLGLKLGAEGFKRFYGEKRYEKLVKKYNKYHFIVPIAAATPVPYVPVCWLSGIFRMNKIKFLSYALIPRTLRFVVVAGFTYWFIG